MRAYDIIRKKRDCEELSRAELEYLIDSYVDHKIPDYEISAFLMAVFLNGMTNEELFYLTDIMAKSGDMLDLSEIEGITIDKHSTGGVGDSTTFLIGPLVAACGLPFAKMSGRGLGHTGGTVDKLESIPGITTSISPEDFIKQVNAIKLCICGQTANIAPADKLLYALRDVTATVDSIPLIASSIMSKKLAIGSDKIILDVKCGSGAFMKDVEQATKLAELMVQIGTDAGKETVAFITNMDEPLGSTIGNGLDIIEVVTMLKGELDGPLLTLSKKLATEALILAGEETKTDAERKIEEALSSGKAFEVFCKMVEAQGGDINAIKDTDNMPKSKGVVTYKAKEDGWISSIDATKIGEASLVLGAGRETKEDAIQMEVGLRLLVRVGSKVEKNQDIVEIYYNIDETVEESVKRLDQAFTYAQEETYPKPLILRKITKSGIENRS